MPSHVKSKEQRTVSERLRLVRLFREGAKQSQRNFCKLNDIAETTFRGWLKDVDAGKLTDSVPAGPQGVRSRSSQFAKVEERLVKYILLRREKFAKDKLGLSWLILREKVLEFAKQELEGDVAESFTASPGWCVNVLRRNGLKGVSLHGEGMEMDNELADTAMKAFRDGVHELMEKRSIPPERVFNADQTGLFHQKLPNRIYCRQEEKRTIRGVKQMKAKERITLMVCTSAVGEKVPLAIVGKSKRPQCWDLCANKPPVAYRKPSTSSAMVNFHAY